MKATVRDVLALYREEMASLGLAEGTIRLRMSHLNRLVRACDQVVAERSGNRRREAGVGDVDAVCVARFFTSLPGAQGDKNNALTAARGFLRYAERNAGATPDLLGDRKGRAAPRKPKHYIPAEQFPDALDLAAEHHPEDRAILALALYTLCRQSEILALQLKDIRLRDRQLSVYRQKMRDHLEITISPDLDEELSWWLSWYASHTGYDSPLSMMTAHPDWYVVPRRRYIPGAMPGDGRWTVEHAQFRLMPAQRASQLERVVKRVLTGLGVEVEDGTSVRHKGEGIHTIRRSGARAMLDHLAMAVGEDKALLRVSTMLGHSNTQMTLKYIGVEIERRQLNDWLMDNRMYGTQASPRPPTGRGTIVQLHREVQPSEPRRAEGYPDVRVRALP